jgi:hypothetical protein
VLSASANTSRPTITTSSTKVRSTAPPISTKKGSSVIKTGPALLKPKPKLQAATPVVPTGPTVLAANGVQLIVGCTVLAAWPTKENPNKTWTAVVEEVANNGTCRVRFDTDGFRTKLKSSGLTVTSSGNAGSRGVHGGKLARPVVAEQTGPVGETCRGKTNGILFSSKLKLLLLNESDGKWYPAVVKTLYLKEREVKLHYTGWKDRWDVRRSVDHCFKGMSIYKLP